MQSKRRGFNVKPGGTTFITTFYRDCWQHFSARNIPNVKISIEIYGYVACYSNMLLTPYYVLLKRRYVFINRHVSRSRSTAALNFTPVETLNKIKI
jgi:hypothetical protein